MTPWDWSLALHDVAPADAWYMRCIRPQTWRGIWTLPPGAVPAACPSTSPWLIYWPKASIDACITLHVMPYDYQPYVLARCSATTCRSKTNGITRDSSASCCAILSRSALIEACHFEVDVNAAVAAALFSVSFAKVDVPDLNNKSLLSYFKVDFRNAYQRVPCSWSHWLLGSISNYSFMSRGSVTGSGRSDWNLARLP
jgi:hypothetical protein